jgi:hypothetical protein
MEYSKFLAVIFIEAKYTYQPWKNWTTLFILNNGSSYSVEISYPLSFTISLPNYHLDYDHQPDNAAILSPTGLPVLLFS